jgi:hypothetical protein
MGSSSSRSVIPMAWTSTCPTGDTVFMARIPELNSCVAELHELHSIYRDMYEDCSDDSEDSE